MRPVNKGTHPVDKTSRGGGRLNVADVYGLYMRALIGRLGEYCSYCEVPLGANLAVEHVLPKINNPTEETTWGNFLLACPNCNSHKGRRPPSRTGYAWPDQENTFVIAMYWLDPADNLCKVAPNPYADGNAQARMAQTIDLVALNAHNPNDVKMSDRRVLNRTATWTRAVTLANLLSTYYAAYTPATVFQAATEPRINLLKGQIRSTAQASGFWSVWMTVFGAANFVTVETRNQLLCDLFISAFPGTNYRIAGTTCQ